MEWYKILVTGFFSFPIALTAILEGPRSAVYPEGTNVTLQCIATVETKIIVWEDIKEKIVIFIDKTKNTQREKFDNFFISDAEGNFSLTIVNAQPSDDGFYSCEEGDESRNANVTIEAGPDLSVFVNNTLLVPEKGIDLTEDDQVVVKCKAEGAKPAVHLTLKFGENEWIETNNITTSDDGLRFTTETSVTHPVSRDDTTVTCKATGQISVPPFSAEISINVLHKPVCRIELKRNIAECQCISNPQVSEYKWYVNGTLQGTELLLQIHEYIPANLTCLATNAVGTGALASRYVSSTNVDGTTSISKAIVIIVIAAVILCGIIICSLVFYCLYKQRREKLPFYDTVCDTSELGGGQSLVSKNDGDQKEVQGANSKPEEKESSEDSEDEQPFLDALSNFIPDEKEENTIVHQRESVDDVTQSNSAGEISDKEPVNSQSTKISYDDFGEKIYENEGNSSLVIANRNNEKEDTASPYTNLPNNAMKQSEPAITSQDEEPTHGAGEESSV